MTDFTLSSGSIMRPHRSPWGAFPTRGFMISTGISSNVINIGRVATATNNLCSRTSGDSCRVTREALGNWVENSQDFEASVPATDFYLEIVNKQLGHENPQLILQKNAEWLGQTKNSPTEWTATERGNALTKCYWGQAA